MNKPTLFLPFIVAALIVSGSAGAFAADSMNAQEPNPTMTNDTRNTNRMDNSRIDRETREMRKDREAREMRDERMHRDRTNSTGALEKAGDYIDDAGITTAVKAKFLTEKGLDSMDISVETNNGVVILSGMVDTTAQKSLAENVASNTDGVRKVDNKLTVKN